MSVWISQKPTHLIAGSINCCGYACNFRVTAFRRLTSKFVGWCILCKATIYTCIQDCVKEVHANAPRRLTHWSLAFLVLSFSACDPVSPAWTVGLNCWMCASWSVLTEPSSRRVYCTTPFVNCLLLNLQLPDIVSTSLVYWSMVASVPPMLMSSTCVAVIKPFLVSNYRS